MPLKKSNSKKLRAAVSTQSRKLAEPSTLLRTKAYEELKRRIVNGEIAPGAFLSERLVAGWLHISKTPVRGAFERLETEGFISISPQQGVVVRELSVSEIADHFELRMALESFVVRNLAGRLRPSQLAKLTENLAAQERAVAQENANAEIVLDGQFHLLLCDFLDNQALKRVMAQLQDRIARVIRQALTRDTERLHTVYPEHVGIVDAISANDGNLAALRMTQHLENGKKTLLSPPRRSVTHQ